MQKSYSIITRQNKYGLMVNNEEVIPCSYDKIWHVTDDLLGLRDGDFWEIYSLKELKTVYPPFLRATLTAFKSYDNSNPTITVPRYLSPDGLFLRSMVFIEDIVEELWGEDSLLVMGELGLIQVTSEGHVDFYNGDDYDARLNQVLDLCWVELPEGGKLASTSKFHYFSDFDADIDEQNYLANLHREEQAFVQELGTVLDGNMIVPEYKFHEKPFIPFDYKALPPAVIEACRRHLDKFYVIDTTEEKFVRNLIFLAWLYANDFVARFEDGMHLVDPRYDFDPLFLFDDTNMNLYYSHEMEALAPILRVSATTGGYLDILTHPN